MNLENEPKAIICLNGELTLNAIPKLPIIAADGAYNKLRKNGIEANYVVGDLDSITGKISDSVKCFYISEQNSTDFEKCIKIAIKLQLYPCLVIGAFGGDIDHSLHNLALVIQYKNSCPMQILQKQQIIIPAPPKLILNIKTNQTVSLMPFPEAVVTTKGLKWELTNQILKQPESSSIRNQTMQDQVIITTKGNLFCIY